MNYQKIYENLTAKDMIADYTEKHHIIPKCMGGSDDKNNLVKLTPEAHYVAHQLLVKIYPDNPKLIYAAQLMSCGKYRNNKSYKWIKQKHRLAVSNALKGRRPPNKGKPHSLEARAKMSAVKKGKIQGAHSAEHKDKLSAANKGKIQKRIICPHCNKEGGANAMKRFHFDSCKYRP